VDFEGRFVANAHALPTSLGLHHHGKDPATPGYTLEEMLLLVRSTVPGQRAANWKILSQVITRARQVRYAHPHFLEPPSATADPNLTEDPSSTASITPPISNLHNDNSAVVNLHSDTSTTTTTTTTTNLVKKLPEKETASGIHEAGMLATIQASIGPFLDPAEAASLVISEELSSAKTATNPTKAVAKVQTACVAVEETPKDIFPEDVLPGEGSLTFSGKVLWELLSRDLILLLRVALDDPHRTVRLAALGCLETLFSMDSSASTSRPSSSNNPSCWGLLTTFGGPCTGLNLHTLLGPQYLVPSGPGSGLNLHDILVAERRQEKSLEISDAEVSDSDRSIAGVTLGGLHERRIPGEIEALLSAAETKAACAGTCISESYGPAADARAARRDAVLGFIQMAGLQRLLELYPHPPPKGKPISRAKESSSRPSRSQEESTINTTPSSVSSNTTTQEERAIERILLGFCAHSWEAQRTMAQLPNFFPALLARSISTPTYCPSPTLLELLATLARGDRDLAARLWKTGIIDQLLPCVWASAGVPDLYSLPQQSLRFQREQKTREPSDTKRPLSLMEMTSNSSSNIISSSNNSSSISSSISIQQARSIAVLGLYQSVLTHGLGLSPLSSLLPSLSLAFARAMPSADPRLSSGSAMGSAWEVRAGQRVVESALLSSSFAFRAPSQRAAILSELASQLRTSEPLQGISAWGTEAIGWTHLAHFSETALNFLHGFAPLRPSPDPEHHHTSTDPHTRTSSSNANRPSSNNSTTSSSGMPASMTDYYSSEDIASVVGSLSLPAQTNAVTQTMPSSCGSNGLVASCWTAAGWLHVLSTYFEQVHLQPQTPRGAALRQARLAWRMLVVEFCQRPALASLLATNTNTGSHSNSTDSEGTRENDPPLGAQTPAHGGSRMAAKAAAKGADRAVHAGADDTSHPADPADPASLVCCRHHAHARYDARFLPP